MRARWHRGLIVSLVAIMTLGGATAGAPTPEHVHFTAAGDYGSTAAAGTVLDALAAGGSDAHFALGDMSYGTTGAEEAWCDFVKGRVGAKFPFETLAGNHESNGINGNINDFSACMPNQLTGVVGTYGRQYYVDVPAQNPLVRFVMISPNLGFPGSPQWNYPAESSRYAWTAAAIDGARTAEIPWVVAGMHKPCVSIGTYECDIGTDLMNLLIAKKVDVVLNGHEHMYQRTKQLAQGAGCTTVPAGTYNPSCVVDSDSSLVQGAGSVFLTIGTGGVGLRDVNLSDPEAGYFVASSGANQNPTYGFGDFDATPTSLTMKFVRGSGGSFADQFTITKDASPNTGPEAAFTHTTANLAATFDASGSTDPDGTIATWAWDFGDGGSGSGRTAGHTYAAAGTYPVKLTVTDNRGASDTLTRNVTVTAPASAVLVEDDFNRTLANGWGRATVGGDWTLRGTTSRFSVNGGAGHIQLPSSSSYFADLNGVSTQRIRALTEFSVDKVVEGTYVAVIGRRTSAADYYAARLTMRANGQGNLYLLRGSGTSLGMVTPPITFTPGTRYRMLLEVKGTSPTSLATKIWKATDPEPAAWQRTATDTFAGLQAAGSPSVFGYLPGNAGANAPVTISFHQFLASAPD